jgi:transmembrane sensor
VTGDLSVIDSTAAKWAVRLAAGPLPADAQAELDAWLETDVRHRGALVRAQAMWLDLDRLAALAPHGESREREPSELREEPTSTPRRRFLMAGLAAATLAAIPGGWWLWRLRGEVYVTEVGEVRRVTLADGSSLALNTDTRAVVHFDEALREVELERGEGLFEVMKDPSRPFIVRVGDITVRAVGTVFVVRALDKGVDVTVTEGAVEVADAGQADSNSPQKVSADERAEITEARGIKIQRVIQADAERHLAWRDGMLAFDGEPLSDAVSEINRHNVRKIMIDDSGLAARPVVGLFRSSDTAGFAQTVAAALGAESSTDGDVIHLRARPR